MKKITAAVAAAIALTACGSNALRFKEVPEGNVAVKSLDEAGSVHVSVVSVMPWADVKEKLRPKLTADEATARAQAVPVTFAMLDRYLDILRLRASIAPNVVKTTESSTSTSATGEDPSESFTRTTEKSPGTARDTPVPDALAAGSKPGDLAASASVNSSLSARAVASYIQEIQALNSEVDHAAQRTGFVPYLLRVQVAVMPLRRHLGYDVYSNLSFFTYSSNSTTPTSEAPFVVPLLSSDSIETAQRSQSIEAIRDIGVALDLIKGFGSVGVGFGSQRDRQQALAGVDVNSVMTMGRLSDNSLRVRFGAAHDAGGGYTTHPRTNTISVLVYLPEGTRRMRVVSRQSWIHVLDGHRLERSVEAYESRLKGITEQFSNAGLTVPLLKEVDEYTLTGNYGQFSTRLAQEKSRWCNGLPDKASSQYVEHCADSLALKLEEERRTAYIWSSLLGLLPGSTFSTNVLDVPYLEPVCPTGAQLAAYQEDENGLSVTLSGASQLVKEKLQAVLHLGHAPKPAVAPAKPAAAAASQAARGQGTKPAAAALAAAQAAAEAPPAPTAYVGPLMASNVDVGANRQSAKLTFSTKGIGALPWVSSAGLQPLAVELKGCKPDGPRTAANPLVKTAFGGEHQLYELSAKLAKAEKPTSKASVTLAAPGTSVVSNKDSLGSVDVVVSVGDDDKNNYAIAVSGAGLRDVTPASSVQARPDGTWLVKQPGALRLSLANLVVNQTVDVEVRQVENNKLGEALRKQPILVRAAPGK